MSNCVTVPNFVAIGQTIVEISPFWIFQDGGSDNLGFLKFYIFNDQNNLKDELRHCAKFCRNRSNHCGDMSVFDFSRSVSYTHLTLPTIYSV